MKFTFLLATLILSSNLFAAETVFCQSKDVFQDGSARMKNSGELFFDFEKKGSASVISNIKGHFFVKNPFDTGDNISTDNSYMGFFAIQSLKANPKYRPNKYKGHIQFADFNATHTTGTESGMWGEFLIDISKPGKTFEARYIFKAGDHMGGTAVFDCRTK